MSRSLTSKSTLETLRKDAKRWLKALRAGDGEARRRLADAWPSAPAGPALRDVQHALAREYGHDGWIALKAAVDDLAMARRSRAERIDIVLRHAWDGDAALAGRIVSRDPAIAEDSVFTAALCGDVAGVEHRLARDPGAAHATGGARQWTALAYVTYGRLDPVNAVTIARRLLAAGADPNFGFTDDWETPFKVLTGAIRLGEGARPSHPQAEALVALLIDAGADAYDSQSLYNVSIVGTDTHWYDVLWRYAEARGVLDAWRVKGEGRLGHHLGVSTLDYLLGNAVGQNHIGRAEWLLARGADANAPHAYSKRPIHAMAQLSGFLDMVALLERHGAAPVPLSGIDAFRAAVLRHDAAAAQGLLAAQPELIRHPATLLAAAELGNAPAVALLLDLGAQVEALDHDGIGPLHRAVQSGSLEAVDRLLAAGADIDRRERRWNGTPLTWSRVLGHPHLTARLAPLSRDVRGLCWLGLTGRLNAVLDAEPERIADALAGDESPTHLFCLPEDEDPAADVVRILLAHGADPGVRNPAGKTAADIARLRGLDEAADLMEAGHAR
ncbi:ankyrin repeat domain-containing protein [Asticcacaulis solisilvae]|uniref:ankyrin repeat domain-containing protein n=1 Tax=Asticcacaulis solisilvae TaxID=1217274 RepID=UPI003FD85CFF